MAHFTRFSLADAFASHYCLSPASAVQRPCKTIIESYRAQLAPSPSMDQMVIKGFLRGKYASLDTCSRNGSCISFVAEQHQNHSNWS